MLVTASGKAGYDLSLRLHRAGAEAYSAPVFEAVPLGVKPESTALVRRRIREGWCAVFTSHYAVRWGLRILDDVCLTRLKAGSGVVYAVGPQTGSDLTAAGYDVTVPKAGMSSTHLAATLKNATPPVSGAVVFSTPQRHQTFGTLLRGYRLPFRFVNVYSTVQTQLSDLALPQTLFGCQKCIVTIHSARSVRLVLRMLKRLNIPFKGVTAIIASERIGRFVPRGVQFARVEISSDPGRLAVGTKVLEELTKRSGMPATALDTFREDFYTAIQTTTA